MTVIASLVILVNQILNAYAFSIAQQLSVFVGLIITNCIVMGRAEGFAMKQRTVELSILDGIGNGLGYSVVILMVVGVYPRAVRRSGTLFGVQVLATVGRRLVRAQRSDAAAAERVFHHRFHDLGDSHLETRASGTGIANGWNTTSTYLSNRSSSRTWRWRSSWACARSWPSPRT